MALALDRPTIVTERLRAEPVEPCHATAMVDVLSDPRIFRFLPDDPPTLEHLERRYSLLAEAKSPDGRQLWLPWIVCERKDEGAPVGFIQATIEESGCAYIGYALHPRHWRRGYASEILTSLLDMLFDRYPVGRVLSVMDTRNVSSIALIRSLGFRRVKTTLHVAEFKGSASHEYTYELTWPQWRRWRAAWTGRTLPAADVTVNGGPA